MFRKKDVIIIALVLLVAALAYGAMLLLRGGQMVSGTVEIYADGVLYASAQLAEPQAITVTQANGEVNVVQIDESGVRMASSSCKNQLCVEQGAVNAGNWTRRAMGRSIICLPNHVLVELALDEGHPSLQAEDIPDI